MRRVYFIKPVGMIGPVKIGCSKSPDNRLSCLATWSPFALEIVASVEGDFLLERRFHAAFLHLHERREWFRWAPDLQLVIDQVARGEFDCAALPEPAYVSGRTVGSRRRWTPFQKERASLNSRVTALTRKTGYRCPHDPYDAMTRKDEAAVAVVHLFLSDPLAHGEPIRALWAENRAAAYREKMAA